MPRVPPTTAGFLMVFWNFMHAVAVTDMRLFYARHNLRSNEIQIDSGGMISSRTQTKQRISMNFLHSYRNQDILWMEERTLIPTGRLCGFLKRVPKQSVSSAKVSLSDVKMDIFFDAAQFFCIHGMSKNAVPRGMRLSYRVLFAIPSDLCIT